MERQHDQDGRSETIRRAFAEFLAFPSLIIAGFLALAAGSYAVDNAKLSWLEPLRTGLREWVFAEPAATSDLLGVIAAGIITVTSITISLLLLALQQAAAELTSEVYDQFLRRRHNQAYFGFFVGLSLYALVTLATVSQHFNPVLGASLAFLLTIVALYLLMALLYTTVNQMRPVEIIDEIHRHVLAARVRQLRFMARTRRSAREGSWREAPVTSVRHGYVTRIDLDALEALAGDAGGIEVVLRVSIGSYVSFGDTIAVLRSQTHSPAEEVQARVRETVRLERQRDLALDPAHGIEQLETIAWTSISTAKSDPAPGLMTIRSLRDVLARWAGEENESAPRPPAPVVYADDTPARLLDAFETLAVVSTESMQHHTFAEILRSFSILFDRLPPQQQARTEDIILRILSGLGDHILTAPLEAELTVLASALAAAGRTDTAEAVRRGRDALARSIGEIHSRATRLEDGGGLPAPRRFSRP